MVLTKRAGAKCDHQRIEVRTHVHAHALISGRMRCVRATQKNGCKPPFDIFKEYQKKAFLYKYLLDYIHSCRARHWVIEYVKIKSDNLQYNKVGRWVNRTIVQLSDGPMFILIDWE